MQLPDVKHTRPAPTTTEDTHAHANPTAPPLNGRVVDALAMVSAMSVQGTDGMWLEDLTVAWARHVKEWDLAQCYPWAEWPAREKFYPGLTRQDIGIDCVAVRRSDGRHVAIQCKSRQLDAHGRGHDITKAEIDSFADTAYLCGECKRIADHPATHSRWVAMWRRGIPWRLTVIGSCRAGMLGPPSADC